MVRKSGKSGKTKKNEKSLKKLGKNGGFWKKSGKSWEKFKKKHQILSVQNYQVPYI